MADEVEGFSEYRKYLVKELERLDKGIGEINTKIDTFMMGRVSKMEIDIAMLKVKAGFIGAVSAMVITGIVEFFAHK